LTPRLPLGDWGYDLKVSPDGRFAFVMSDGQHVIRLDALGLDDGRSPASLITFGEIISGQRALPGGGSASLTSEDWLERWRAFRNARPEDRGLMFSREAARAWHESQAEVSRTWLQWDAARWHLDRVAASGGAVEAERLTRLEEFVRAWQFSKVVEPWTSYDSFVAVDAAKLRAIEASALEGRLMKSRGPYIDFILQFPERTGDVVAYAVRTIEAEHARKVKVLAGADDSIRVWWNGYLVLEDLAIQPPIPDQVSAAVELRPGSNTLTVEVSQAWSMWGFFLRLEDEDGTKLRLTDDGRLERLEARK
jgi:hypothetical protein